MYILLLSFVTVPFLYEVTKYPEIMTHLSLWTWMLHICSFYSYLYSSDVDNSVILTASVIGSRYIYYAYIFSLLVNPYLEYDLINESRPLWKDKYIWTLARSIYYHGLPYFASYYYDSFYQLNNNGILMYVFILFIYLVSGMILKCFNNYMLSPYHIYITTNNNRNIVISELGFILVQTLLLLRIICLNLKT